MDGIKFKPIAYLGVAMSLIGIPGVNLMGIHDALIQTIGAIASIVGIYLIYKGVKATECSAEAGGDRSAGYGREEPRN